MNSIDILYNDFENILSSHVLQEIELLKGKCFFITGISGMIGEYLTRFLFYISEKYSLDIHIIGVVSLKGNSDSKFAEFIKNGQLKIVKGDIRNIEYEGEYIDYIIHAASLTSPYAYEHLPVDVATINLLGTLRMLELCRNNGATLLLLSSSSIYGAAKGEIDEQAYGPLDPLDVRSCYSEGKRAAEMLCIAYNHQYDVKSKIVRCRRVYGPTTNFRVESLINKLFLATAKNESVDLYRDPGNFVQLLYVGDAITGILKVLLTGNVGEAYNICSDAPITIDEFAELLSNGNYNNGNLTINWKNKEEINDEVRLKKQVNRNNAACISDKLQSIGWIPLFSIKEGLENTVNYLNGCLNE